MKKTVRFIAVPLLVFVMVTQTFASSPKIVVSNKELPVSGVSRKERILVPLRAIFETLDATVDYDPSTKTITGKQDDKTIILKINDKVATVNGEKIVLDVPATIVNESTLVPVRFIAESLGAAVEWRNKTVLINSDIPLPEGELSTYEEFMIDHGAIMFHKANDLAVLGEGADSTEDEGEKNHIRFIQNQLQDINKALNDFTQYKPIPEKYVEAHKFMLLIAKQATVRADLILNELASSQKITQEIFDQIGYIANCLQVFMIQSGSEINDVITSEYTRQYFLECLERIK